MYDQSPLTTVIHPSQFLLHNGNQDVQQQWHNGARQDVLLIGEWARLISSRQRRLRNGQRNHVLFSNLQSMIMLEWVDRQPRHILDWLSDQLVCLDYWVLVQLVVL